MHSTYCHQLLSSAKGNGVVSFWKRKKKKKTQNATNIFNFCVFAIN